MLSQVIVCHGGHGDLLRQNITYYLVFAHYVVVEV